MIEQITALAWPGLAIALGLATVVWLASLVKRDASIIDIFWGLGFVTLAWFYRSRVPADSFRQTLVPVLVTLWGLRLSIYILWRNWGRGEDYRYAAMRSKWGAGWPLTSLVIVFWLQGFLLWLIGMPLLQVQVSWQPAEVSWFDLLGLALFAIGFFFEAVGDFQLARFKADPINKGKVLDRGLWRYTRHPNYFGDATLWWGFGCLALATPGSSWTLVSPLLMSLLIVKVSGVALLEEGLRETKPEYRDYVQRTSAFFPWIPRGQSPQGPAIGNRQQADDAPLSPPTRMIRFDGVTHRFGDVKALREIDLEIEAGRTTVLIGPSGCGKSTLLRLVVGLMEATAGRVAVGDQTVGPDTALDLRRRMGYVIQGGGLFPHLTAGENVTLMARHLRRPDEEIERRLAELCALTHFPENALVRFPLELSGGQQQRVGLMRALMLDPEVLLLDEPLGALDPLVRRDLQQELREIFGALHRTVLLVTHDLAEAAYLADRIVLLRAGGIVQTGSLDDLRERPADPFVTRFLSAQRPPVEL